MTSGVDSKSVNSGGSVSASESHDDSYNIGGPSGSSSTNSLTQATSAALKASTEGYKNESQESTSSRKSFVIEYEDSQGDIPPSCCQKVGECFRNFFSSNKNP
jgi:hypothetical protein